MVSCMKIVHAYCVETGKSPSRLVVPMLFGGGADYVGKDKGFLCIMIVIGL